MRAEKKSIKGIIGVRVKSGWASTVLLVGTRRSPQVVHQCMVGLSDPEMPESKQPYHARMGKLEQNRARVKQRTDVVRRVTAKSVSALLKSYRQQGYKIRRATLVVGSDIDPAVIGNPHVRAHALEGRLFRTVLEKALRLHRTPFKVIVERNLYLKAKTILGGSEASLKRALTQLGPAGGRWRAEEKNAALAAWISLV